jgi:putative DNA primase/helicase
VYLYTRETAEKYAAERREIVVVVEMGIAGTQAEQGDAAVNLRVPGTSFNADVLAALEIASFPHWLCWNFESVPGRAKPQKVPKNPRTGRNASSTNPADWVYLDIAVGRALREGWGVGFVFHATLNPFAGVDLDHCRDPHTGAVVPWAKSIIDAFRSYTEVSPSGCGVKIIVRGKPKHNGKKAGLNGAAVEVYGAARYFTMTGWAL